VIDLARILRTVVAILERSEVGYVVVGSTAAASWGVARATRDIDIVVVVDADGLDAVIGGLQGEGLYVPVDDARRARASGGSFNVLDPDHGGKIDLFVTGSDDAFTTSRLERCIRAEVFDVPCWVASAEDVVLAKLRWRLTSRSEVQWRDCIEIAATNDLDTIYLRHWAHKLGITHDLEDLLDAASDTTAPG
jgi:hypothetical protein